MVNNRPLLAFGQVDFLIATNLLQPFDAVKQGIPTQVVAAFFQTRSAVPARPSRLGLHDVGRAQAGAALHGQHGPAEFLPLARTQPTASSAAKLRPYNHSLAPFLVDKTAVMQGYATAEPKRVEEALGREPAVFLLADHGWSSYSTLLETRVELIEKNPDLVQRFVDASILGWHRYLDDDDVSAANALIQRDNPAMTDAQIAFSRAKMREWGLVDSGDARDAASARWTLSGFASSTRRWSPPGCTRRTTSTRRPR